MFLNYENKTAPEGTYFVEVNYPELIPYGLISKTALERAELLKKYKTITKLKEVDIEELKKILPENVAKNLKEFLENY